MDTTQSRGAVTRDAKAWGSCVKSAMQKSIRRGNVGQAVAAARILDAINPTGLRNRLPIIMVEDVLTASELAPRVERDPIGVVAAMARLPKDKDCCGLMNKVYAAGEGTATKQDLEAAVKENDPFKATLSGWRLWHSGRRRDVTEVLRNELPLFGIPGDVGGPVARAFMGRAMRGTFFEADSMVLIAGAALARMGRIPPVSVSLEVPPEEPFVLRWFATDQHTPPGRVAAGSVAKKLGIDTELLKQAWFWCESSLLDPANTGKMEWWGRESAALHWAKVEFPQLQKLWSEIRTDLQGMTVWAGRKIFGIEISGD